MVNELPARTLACGGAILHLIPMFCTFVRSERDLGGMQLMGHLSSINILCGIAVTPLFYLFGLSQTDFEDGILKSLFSSIKLAEFKISKLT